MAEGDDSVLAVMRAGARGYLLKGANQAEILRAIRAVGNGEAIFGPGVARRLMGFFVTPKLAAPAQLFPELTEREIEVVTLIARGFDQSADRQTPLRQCQNGPQPRLEPLQQTPGRRPRPGRRRGRDTGLQESFGILGALCRALRLGASSANRR